MDELNTLDQWLGPMLRRLEPAGRARLARRVALDLQRAQSERINRQQAPDGTPYARRKPQKKLKAGRIRRRRMFAKLRQNRHLKARGTASEATVFFIRRAAAIARTHQEGLIDEVRRGGPRVRYERRTLLGYSADDRQMIVDSVLNHVAGL